MNTEQYTKSVQETHTACCFEGVQCKGHTESDVFVPCLLHRHKFDLFDTHKLKEHCKKNVLNYSLCNQDSLGNSLIRAHWDKNATASIFVSTFF